MLKCSQRANKAQEYFDMFKASLKVQPKCKRTGAAAARENFLVKELKNNYIFGCCGVALVVPRGPHTGCDNSCSAVYSVQCTVCSVQFVVCSVFCIVCSV